MWYRSPTGKLIGENFGWRIVIDHSSVHGGYRAVVNGLSTKFRTFADVDEAKKEMEIWAFCNRRDLEASA